MDYVYVDYHFTLLYLILIRRVAKPTCARKQIAYEINSSREQQKASKTQIVTQSLTWLSSFLLLDETMNEGTLTFDRAFQLESII